MMKSSFARALACAFAALFPALGMSAYPEKPITMIVAYPPGGGTDIVARAIAPYIEKYLGGDAKIVRVGDVEALRRGGSREAWIAGYLNLVDRRFDAWTAAPVTSRAYGQLYGRAMSDRKVMQTIGAGYVLSSRPLGGTDIVPLVRTDGVYASRLADPWPMARVLLQDGRVVPVRSIALDSAQARVIVETPAEGLLVLTQCDWPGWRVTVDGNPSRKEIVDGVFRAVRVPRGRHEVRWRFFPRSLVIGATITALAIAALLLNFFLARAR